ncbi:zonular occludens toxin family protein [Delftia tsuruhatensis]|uniref:zonular occludens toxin family protein n=1 Tax=Delftia tsuruhatensis TaxID=180282 RepID=UPI0009E57132|nr:zonular occludens toxin domain-containing protein [Delftia tsuruhatensis]
MLTLITGNPGTGKSAALVSMLEELGKERQLYVNGIPELLIPHIELTEPEKWHETVPDGSVIIIDEVQRIWRPSGPGQKIPDMIALLETHRHRGLDFYIITQGPNLIHANVRALIGRHVHLRDLGILGRWWYEWPECADNCRTGWKNAPIKKRYRLPKSVFGKYKSASIHVKPVRSFPWMLVVMIVALVTVFVMSWFAYRAINARLHPVAPEPVSATPNAAVGPSRQDAPVPPVTSPVVAPDERVAFIPRLSDRPWTAPAYDEIRRVVAMPLITGAMCINDHCVCFNGSRRLLDVSSVACDEWRIQRPFNPYDAEPVLVDGGGVSDRIGSNEGQSVPVPGAT